MFDDKPKCLNSLQADTEEGIDRNVRLFKLTLDVVLTLSRLYLVIPLFNIDHESHTLIFTFVTECFLWLSLPVHSGLFWPIFIRMNVFLAVKESKLFYLDLLSLQLVLCRVVILKSFSVHNP